MPTAAERAARGAAWLDQFHTRWATKIDTTALDLYSPCNCIIGQLFGTYTALKKSRSWAEAHGFLDDHYYSTSYDIKLQNAWLREIHSRKP